MMQIIQNPTIEPQMGALYSLPLASILCVTYNQVDYIRQCLDGLVMQQTDFPFEIIVYDDASTDGTQDIIREYEQKYSHIINPIYQTENQYSKRIRVFPTYIYPKAQGKYIAMCEGDDYWTDPLKLKKQVLFLEQNPDYSLVYTNYRQYFQKTGMWKEPSEGVDEGDVYESLLCRRIRCQILTTCFRQDILEKMPNLPEDFFHGDLKLFLSAALCGKFKYLPDITAVYRILPISMSHFLSYKEDLAFSYETTKTTLFFMERYPITRTKENLIIIKTHYFLITRHALLSGNYSEMGYVKFLLSPLWTMGSVTNTILCVLCKYKLFFFLISKIANIFMLKKWQRKYEKLLYSK